MAAPVPVEPVKLPPVILMPSKRTVTILPPWPVGLNTFSTLSLPATVHLVVGSNAGPRCSNVGATAHATSSPSPGTIVDVLATRYVHNTRFRIRRRVEDEDERQHDRRRHQPTLQYFLYGGQVSPSSLGTGHYQQHMSFTTSYLACTLLRSRTSPGHHPSHCELKRIRERSFWQIPLACIARVTDGGLSNVCAASVRWAWFT